MANLYQPVYSKEPEPGHDAEHVLELKQFIDLLREEEDYWSPDQHNTSLMISKLRKIFYDQWGWNSELIKGAASIKTRYQTEIKNTTETQGQEIARYKNYIYTPVYRVVTYTAQDRVYGNTRVGQIPFIYQHDHQEVKLPDGTYCDVAHILAGLDAINYKRMVTPLPSFLSFLAKLFPHVDSNVDVVTWIGDIASSSADFLFDYLKNGDRVISIEEQQVVINSDAPGSDMLGDIEPYVIAHHYDVSTSNGMRITDILTDYYSDQNAFRSRRLLTFCELIGLQGWNGVTFSNETAWLTYYHKQLRDAVTFVAFSQNEKSILGFLLPLKIWFNMYQKVLRLDTLLQLFVQELKRLLNQPK